MPHYHVDNDFSKARDIDGDLNWLVINYLYESIDNDKDWVVIIFFPIHWNW